MTGMLSLLATVSAPLAFLTALCWVYGEHMDRKHGPWPWEK